ncbi:MAG: hypothetical protein AB1416_09685, partial [Actinomycetota bacterium]
VADVRARRVAGLVVGAARGARHLERAGVIHGAGAREVVATGRAPMPLQADGEALGRHDRIVFTEGPRLLVLRPPAPGVAPPPPAG